MALVNFKSTLSNKRNFQEITKGRPDLVEKISNAFFDDVIVRIYEHKGTVIIHSESEKSGHASVSNPYRDIQEWEIEYAIDHFLKEENVNRYLDRNSGVMHLNSKVNNQIKK
ncbi:MULTISPECIES: DUF1827 family protein [Lysinibacillus]|uniref:Uncharacterized protein n=1 Tax=Lysinibacillus fusiformis TaxID=28031 RepID=A0A1E4RAH8_9BACI|nr:MULTISPECIES: DUF1827 family protein [Lysinibacillus]ODV57474.1 hypothetical protein BG258_16895 [Lysinibacillus fusiformis]